MNDEIDSSTYKKWRTKFQDERRVIANSMYESEKAQETGLLDRLDTFLPQLTNLRSLYKRATFKDRQTLIRGVFKHRLSYSEGSFRTPEMNSLFKHNSLKAKEKGLLVEEEPEQIWDQVPFSTTYGNRTYFYN